MTHTTIDSRTLNTVTMNVSATLVREQMCTPTQAIATAVVFADNLDRLVGSTHNWAQRMVDGLDDTTVDDVEVEPYDVIFALLQTHYIDNLLGSNVFVAGEKTIKMIDEVRTTYAPALASEGVERRRDYATIHVSPLFKEAIHTLEDTKFMPSDIMLSIARSVYEAMPEDSKLQAQEYVVKGTSEMVSGEAYISEFFGDKRGRIYQAACYGPNGQSSDMARALMDLHGVSMDYNENEVKVLLVAEMKDMGGWVNKKHFIADMNEAVMNPVQFIIKHMHKKYNIKKAWNFTKFSLIMSDIQAGNHPYIGVAVGLDAKCSGPQLASCMVGDEKMLAATGFTTKEIDDAYHNTLTCARNEGITGLTRALIKKSFMAVFYGAGEAAMLVPETINPETWDALYTGLTTEQMKKKAESFYKAIILSFGPKLNNLRSKIKQGGFDYETKTPKFDKPVRHFMPDGLEVAMEYMVKLNMDGDVIDQETAPVERTTVSTGLAQSSFRNMTFNTKEYNHADFARTGFVNMIQATDALLARLIVVHANRLGAQHIISVHDCFRVNIHDMAILQQAIKNAYLDLFGSDKNEHTEDMPLGTDIIGLYFQGTARSTIEGIKPEYASQFYGKSQIRRMDEVDGVSFTTLVNNLGNTSYFAK